MHRTNPPSPPAATGRRGRHADKLLREYTALAPAYDERWAHYLAGSLAMTEAAVGERARDARVLDVACGTGLWLARLAERGHGARLLVGVDRVPAMLARARACHGDRLHLLAADALRLPFAEGAFDLVTTTSALHYFDDVPAALGEMSRVLAPCGRLVVTDWCRDYLTIKLLDAILPWTPEAHRRALTGRELAQALAQVGFHVDVLERRRIDWFWGLMSARARLPAAAGRSP